jgi:hypothetical protein
MAKDPQDSTRAAAARVIGLEEEVEASGVASVDVSDVEQMRIAVHAWVDASVGFVVSPGLGRVTVIHEGGKRSTIASPTLPYLMSKPVGR